MIVLKSCVTKGSFNGYLHNYSPAVIAIQYN